MPVPPQYINAEYILTRDGELLFLEFPLFDSGESIGTKRRWKFSMIGQDHLTFLEFLKEAFSLGAQEDEVIRIACDSNIQNQFPNRNVLHYIGITGRELRRRPKKPGEILRINPVKPM